MTAIRHPNRRGGFIQVRGARHGRAIRCVGGPLAGGITTYTGKRQVVEGGEYRVDTARLRSPTGRLTYMRFYQWFGLVPE